MRAVGSAFGPAVTSPSRRQLLLGTVGALGAWAAACAPSRPRAPSGASRSELADVEAKVGGRLGVFALDTGTGRALAHRPDERFTMCSTFKWALAAAVLARVDRAELSLDRRVAYGPSDLLEHAPITRAHVAAGSLSIEDLARAAVVVSDNTAANLLLRELGGPASVTAFARACGDGVTRLDRTEPALNEQAAGDVRDTTTPRAMVGLMQRVLCPAERDAALSTPSRERLLGWLRACETGKARLRAGFPSDWTAGDKTGSGPNGTVNDVAIAWPPGRAPILVAAYMSGGAAPMAALQAAHVDVARAVVRELG